MGILSVPCSGKKFPLRFGEFMADSATPAPIPPPTVASALAMAAKAAGRKFAADAANQVVTALCAGIFMALLYYLGRDFFYNKLADSDQTIKAWLYLVFYHLANAFLAKYLVSAKALGPAGGRSLGALLRFLGEPPAKVRRILALLTGADMLLVAAALIALASSPYLPYSALVCGVIFAGYVAAITALRAGFQRLSTAPTTSPGLVAAESFAGKVRAMMSWRWRQLYRRNFSTLFYGLLTVLALATGSLLAAGGLDYRLAGFLFVVAGFFIAAPLFHQLQADLSSSWFERNNPVSHSQVIACYFGLSARLLIIWLTATGALLAALALGLAEPGTITARHSATWLGLAAIAPLLAPGLLFQIDGHRPAIQLTILFMAVVVLGSLVLIEPLAWLAIPVITYVACHYQQGRFYRS